MHVGIKELYYPTHPTAQGRVKDLEKQVSQYSEELNSLTGVKEKLTTLEEEIKSLMKLNQVCRIH